MKLLLAAFALFLPLVALRARPVNVLSNQEMFNKADLVAIARPVSTKDTAEQRDLPGMEHVHVIGVETALKVSVVLKGRKSIKSLALHHYRWNPRNADAIIIDGPSLLNFDPKGEYNGDYLLFLVRESDGRYAPVTGQVDPAITSVQGLWNANHWKDIKDSMDERRAKHD